MSRLYRDVLHTINDTQPASEGDVALALGANIALVSTVIDCLVSDGFANKGGGNAA
jgi:hypothetical protein